VPPRPPKVINDFYNPHGLPVNFNSEVTVQELKINVNGEQYPTLFKEYTTPAVIFRAEVRQDPEWRRGDHFPFLVDYLVSRSLKFIVDGPDGLNALRYLLISPTPEEITAFQVESESVLAFAKEHDLLISGGWCVGSDLICWVYGLNRLSFLAYDDPEFITEMLEIISVWNRAPMEVVLKAGGDLYIKRACYENCDYFTPRNYRQFILPILEADIKLAHQYGAKFWYIITSNCMALLDNFCEVGVGAIIAVDPTPYTMGFGDDAR
jgi:hypothetical protein